MRRRLIFLTAISTFLVSSILGQSRSDRREYFADGFLDTLQRRTFNFFWECTNPATGLVPDRAPTVTFSSTAAIGFGLTAYGIGAERGYVSRHAAAERVLTTLQYLWNARQGADATGCAGYRGFFYHFLDYKTGNRFDRNIELSTIDTALLMAGVLFAQSYFDRADATEQNIRSFADSLFQRVDWRWMQVRPPLLCHGWDPVHGVLGNDWGGYCEAGILYVLAYGSQTHPIAGDAWQQWTRGYVWANYFGNEFISFGPLFGHQYSHCWIDFKGIQDPYMKEKGIDYFENARRATKSQREYGKKNPQQWRGYSTDIWGWTACDGPGDRSLTLDGRLRRFSSYSARGVSADWSYDDGTIAPTAAGGSVAFAPEIAVPALRAMKEQYGSLIWRKYGFCDAFNPSFITDETPQGWADIDYLGIDQGPIVIMIENLRDGLVWKTMEKNPVIRRGLERAGFTGGWLKR
ncbi:MAG: hypothetical protein NTV54_10090 [Ignavibacteriales bacterium]|nr:hypothetical protein [Ignavibacteriales bacterium]